MQYSPSLRTTTISEIERGTCFAFELRNETFFGIAVEPRGGTELALVVVSPGHPSLEGQVGIFDGSVVRNRTLLAFPEARIILPTAREHMHVDFNEFHMPPGALFLAKDALVIAASDGSRSWGFNAADGAIVRGDLTGSAWFSAWEIAVPDIKGEWQTLCHVSTKSSEE
ncbi:hypothetical protein [Microvirga aerophila]|uniref:Uncharacterized protein n=1 Tax=Microvirga aerophila TaxID=670291 RepID=A0A512C1J4_9HYPH|nr:hypothetical protein [Microvirga aerophila]GEO18070.1 hypothetical protein MAE02_57660 [Microvirga aerophila]